MDFTIDDEQRALRDAVRDMASRFAPPEERDKVPTGPRAHDAKAWTALAEMGLLGLPFAEDAGGMDATAVEVVLAAAELGKARVQTAYGEALVAASLLAAAGDQKALLEKVIDGSALVLPAFAEPMRAWAPHDPSVTASGGSLSGVKAPVPIAEVDAVLVTACEGDQTGVYLVDSPQVSDGALKLDGTAATKLNVSADDLDAALNLGIVALAGEALGAMDAALAMTVDYLKTRKQFGVPLMTFQTLTQRAADMYVSVELARSTVLYGAMTLAERPSDNATASRVKVLTGRTGRHVGQEAIQLHGGIGMTAEYAVGHYTTRLTAIEHTFGDTRYHLGQLARDVSDHAEVDVFA
ncbi:acyl-CoA dehydrogenase [Calidifontibacter sp. DB0510]|uniref:Acyl-CoA dehydrogenase n=1 Tax=Metallococcus carri TaxID=1656884 RepID=A0A967B0D6_9MICO|nr:acyl-CoA dehydrogenase family protein [Metallococcus carri]NHN55100.1 acyl-CoA dehydrogenase [Metallococcus carri]NOP36177.1 acyl-CoA dehydrogenase [Calidifontibacter sp. DB2511S]